MGLPGFHAEQSIGPPSRTYRGTPRYAPGAERSVVLPVQFMSAFRDVGQDAGAVEVIEGDEGASVVDPDMGQLDMADEDMVEQDLGAIGVVEEDENIEMIDEDAGSLAAAGYTDVVG